MEEKSGHQNQHSLHLYLTENKGFCQLKSEGIVEVTEDTSTRIQNYVDTLKRLNQLIFQIFGGRVFVKGRFTTCLSSETSFEHLL